MAKRSPILGYNHNVRYRGLVFHVQTEDSGVLSPHLFTHLFYGGVIVSTRKLVYDAGANEEAIKALMQAQHKAVMKDLKKGSFDDKIDQYLAGTPGLEPRAQTAASRAATELDPPPVGEAAVTAQVPAQPEPEPETPVLELEAEPPAPEPVTAPVAAAPTIEIGPPESAPVLLTQKSRTQTVERTSAPTAVRSNLPPPPPPEDDAPTISGNAAGSVAAAVQAANASVAPVSIKVRTPSGPLVGRTPTPPSTTSLPRVPTPPQVPRKVLPQDLRLDSSPEIEISIEDDARARMPRDTLQQDVTVPNPSADQVLQRRTPTGDRPASHVGATLPPAPRPPTRPTFTPPQVVTRPLGPRDSGPVEIHGTPPQPEPPAGERPGQYSMPRTKNPSEQAARREQTGRMPKLPNPAAPPTPPAAAARPQAPAGAQPRMATPPVGSPAVRPEGARPGTAVRVPQTTMPMANRPAPNGGVVMTRPAVVVGAPPKAPAQQRIRKAREDEGRGFGQGLISEKSLDEVILAYLSEDAEEK